MKPIRILCIINSLNKCNGIASFMINYYKCTNHDKFKYDFLITDNSFCEEYKEEIEKNGDRVIFANRIKPKNCIKEMKDFKNLLQSNHYDIVYSHVFRTAFFYFIVAKKQGIKHRILHSHSNPSKDKNALKEFAINIMCKLGAMTATDYFACSVPAGKYLFGKRDFKILNNAINIDGYLYNENIRNEYRIKMNLEDKLVIGHIGRFSEEKNQIYLVDVIEKLKEKNKNVKLLLVGDGVEKNNVEEYVKSKQLDEYIEFLGESRDVKNLLQAIDIFVLPSWFEGLPIAAIEAQMSGLPCLFSNGISRETAIIENVEFLGIAQDNIDDWCEGILKYKDAKRVCDREKLEHSGYNIKNEAHKLEDLFTEMI